MAIPPVLKTGIPQGICGFDSHPLRMAYTVDLREKSKDESTQPEAEKNSDAISWVTSLSHIPAKRNAFIAVIVLTLAAAGVIYFHQDFLFAALLILAGIVLVITAFKNPEQHEISIDTASITVHDKQYFFSQIKSFWINYNPPHEKELILVLKKSLMPMIRIPLETVNPLEIRKAMISLVPEKEYEDSLLDQIVKKLNI